MLSQAVILPLCIVLFGFSWHAFAAYGDACTKDADCTAADNTLCTTPTGCVKGSCTACKDTYKNSGTKCLKPNGETCAADGDCNSGNCDTGGDNTCKCPTGETWQETYMACVTTNKAFGDACTTLATDCAVVAAGNGLCSTTCTCASGYVKDTGVSHTCRKPYFGESGCIGAVGCIATAGMLGATVPDCTSSKCVCATGDEEITYEGTTFCSTKVAEASQLVNTQECTTHSECVSKLCTDCKGTPSGKACVEAISTCSGASSVMFQPILASVLALVAALILF